jgi:hypothetical protein
MTTDDNLIATVLSDDKLKNFNILTHLIRLVEKPNEFAWVYKIVQNELSKI